MAMPALAYYLKKVYADKSLSYDANAKFEVPAQLNNAPIFADQTFKNIIQKGRGSDRNEQTGNGNAGDYSVPDYVPTESDFEVKPKAPKNKPVAPSDYMPVKKDTSHKNKK